MAGSHADDSMVGPHGTTEDHGDVHGHDDHAHTDATGAELGPLDVASWAAGIGGLLLGVVVAVAFAFASGTLRG